MGESVRIGESDISIDTYRELLLQNLWLFHKQILQKDNPTDMMGECQRELCNLVDIWNKNKKMILIPRGHLKQLRRSTTKVLTPEGWMMYKDLRVGDEVIGGNGEPTRVVKIHPTSKNPMYEVTTNDGRSVVCNKEHEFLVRVCSNSKEWKVRELGWIMERYSKERLDKRDGKTHYEHPVQLQPIPVYYTEKELPLDPYFLGLWLGDGTSKSPDITTMDSDIAEEVYSQAKKYDLKVRISQNINKTCPTYCITSGRKYGLKNRNVLLNIFNDLNLISNKHIPEDFLTSGYSQRMELLKGLMDTDGTHHCQGGIAYFSNTNYRLIQDFVSLVRSLGGVAFVCKVNMEYNGKPYDSWQVSVRLPKGLNPFKLKRKAEKFTGLKRELTINIVDIKEVGDDLANCITVENEDGMFIANDYFPTHNSATITVGYAVQQICKDPNLRILIGSETNSKAKDFLKNIRDIFEKNERLRYFFGNHQRTESRWTDDEITSNQRTSTAIKEPTVFTTGTDQTRTGAHCDMAIIDDPTSHTNITEQGLRKTLQWYREISNNILDPGGKLIVIGTRWHFADIFQHILDEQKEFFDIVVRQAISDEGYDILRRSIPIEEKREMITNQMILFPEKFTVDRLWEIYSGSTGEGGIEFFNNQYMNRIVSSENADFRDEDLRWYDPANLKKDELNVYITIDPAISEKQSADFSVIMAIGVNEKNDWYVLDYDQFKGKPNELIDRTFRMYSQYPHTRKIGVETTAYQKSLVYSFRDEMRKREVYLPITEIKGRSQQGNKEMRIRGVLNPLIKQRRLHLQSGMIELREQLRTFPRSKNDDLVDSLSSLADIQGGYKFQKGEKNKNETREQKDDREAQKQQPWNPRMIGRSRFTKY